MKPINFEGYNKIYAENQPEYTPLPVLKFETDNGEAVSCWNLSFKERIRVLFTGKIWLTLLTFNKPLTPSYITTKRKELFTLPSDDLSWYKKIFRKK